MAAARTSMDHMAALDQIRRILLGSMAPKSATAWTEPPRPLEEYLSPVLSITADMMPEAMGDWASNIATDLRCPLDFPAAAIIVGTGAVLASRVRIRPSRQHREAS